MMKVDARLENNIFDTLMCRESRSFTRSIHGPKGKKIRRESRIRARRTLKMLRRIK